jgi:asparagine synthase (glutamine-hydrolysing)
MGASLSHRGPDSEGYWLSNRQGIGLAHRRLSIVDQSWRGSQPMKSKNNRWVMAFNGEIYNHLELRSELDRSNSPVYWTGHSDTETLIECFAQWGVEKTLRKSVGMFAICLWDSERNSLTLARDRMGEKPLYFGLQKGIFGFGSELKALEQVEGWKFDISPEAVASFIRYGYVPEPYSIFGQVWKVPAGTFLDITPADISRGVIPESTPYWSFLDVARSGTGLNQQPSRPQDLVDGLDELLSNAVAGQLLGDAPIGAFLSGGVDSSVITALMQKLSSNRVKTFSIGFENPQYDESKHAREVADYLGTDHHELVVTEYEALNVIPKLPEIYDEPFGDSSQIPTYLVSQLAKSEVKVSLSGDGADELFAGYSRYSDLSSLWPLTSRVPGNMRSALASWAQRVPPAKWDSWLQSHLSPLPAARRKQLSGDRIHKFAKMFDSPNSREFYSRFSAAIDPSSLVLGGTELELEHKNSWPIESNLLDQMLALDSISYLPGDILPKVDRASMAHGLESRMPFLDHRVIEFAWSISHDFKLRGNVSKWVLKGVLERYVPKEIYDRPKKGFSVPVADWIRGPLKDWASELLEPARISEGGWFRPDAVDRLWNDHQSGHRNFQSPIWNILMFESWRRASRNDERNCEKN